MKESVIPYPIPRSDSSMLCRIEERISPKQMRVIRRYLLLTSDLFPAEA